MGDGRSFLATGLHVEGAVEGDGNLAVAGELQGPVRLGGELHVLPGGHVRGDVVAARVRVEGVLEGRVRATQQISVGPRGRLLADVYGVLLLDEGGVFRGRIQGEIAPSEPVRSPPPAPPPEPLTAVPREPRAPAPGTAPSPPAPRPLAVPVPLVDEIVDDLPPAAPSTASIPVVTDADLRRRQGGWARVPGTRAEEDSPPSRQSEPFAPVPTARPASATSPPVPPRRVVQPAAPLPRRDVASGTVRRSSTQPSAERPAPSRVPTRPAPATRSPPGPSTGVARGIPPASAVRPDRPSELPARPASGPGPRAGEGELDDPWFDDEPNP